MNRSGVRGADDLDSGCAAKKERIFCMKKQEKNAILEWAKGLSNEELEKEYYDLVYNSLGSEAEEMYERGYDMADIREQEELEKYLHEKVGILEMLCEERGIKLWEEEKPLDEKISDAQARAVGSNNNVPVEREREGLF